MRRHLNPSLVLSIVAVFIALGGTSYAISKLPNNSVGTKQLKKNSVNSAKVKDRSLLAKDFKKGQLPKGAPGAVGATGPAGIAGPTGPEGSAKAYAYISDDAAQPSVPADKAKGITAAMVSRPSTGVYCFELSSIWPVKNVSAVAEPNYGNPAESDKLISAQILEDDTFGLGCPNTSDMVVTVRDISSSTNVNWFFYVTLN